MNIWAIYQILKDNNVSILENASKHTTPDGSVRYTLIKVKDLGDFFQISNPSEYFRKMARSEREDKFIEFIPQPMGRPAMYIAEPIFYEFLLTANNPICKKIQNWMFDKVINRIANDGLYTKEMENV
jgi:prophage antirepressor-like protein